MIYYKAVCRAHGWESPGLYATPAAAMTSARSHRNSSQEPHDIVILEVYIPQESMAIRSETAY